MNRLRHFVHRSGHHMWRMMLWFQVGILVATFLPVPDRAMTILLAVGIVTVGFAFCFGAMVHERSLCEPCIGEMPLNGPQKAEDWERYLAAFHWLFRTNWQRFVLVLVLWLAYNQAVGRIPSDKIEAVAVFIPTIIFLTLVMRHSRVQPWCKRCGWDDGGGNFIETPVPDPAVSR